MRLKVLLASLLIGITGAVSAADFKCHMLLEDGKQRVTNFDKTKVSLEELKKSLRGYHVYQPDGVTKIGIRRVYECIDQKDLFSSAYARQLDETTPR